jgi:hypothetical protein
MGHSHTAPIKDMQALRRLHRFPVFPAVLLLAGILAWSVLFTSLVQGRTTPATVSLQWLAMSSGLAAAAVAWHLLAALAIRSASGLPIRAVMRWAAGSSTPLLLSLPALVAVFLSDQLFHYLTYNPIPRAVAIWAPLLLTLACQEAALLWLARLGPTLLSWLRDRRAAPVLIFASFASLYIFSAGGHLYSPDERLMYGVTASIAEGILTPTPGQGPGVLGQAELASSKYGLVPSLLALPAYLISTIAGWNPEPPSYAFPLPDGSYPLVGLTVGPLTTAATCALLYLLARQLGFGALSSLVVVLAYGIGTSAWVYSKAFFSQPPATLFLVAAIYLLFRQEGRHVRNCGLAGTLLGLAAGTRVELALLAVPLLAVFVLTRPGRDLRQATGETAVMLLAFLAVSGLTVGWYNYLKTGSVLMTGYGAQGTFDGFSPKPYIGIFGTFFSPGFGLFTFNPVALLGILSLPVLALSRQRESYLFGGLIGIAVLFYGSFGDWYGGFTWANRYLLVILPLAVLPLAVLIERPWRNAMSVLLVSAAIALGMVVNFLAVLVDFNNGWQNLWNHQAGIYQILWTPHFSPIGAHFRVLGESLLTGSKLDLYLYYKLGIPSLAGAAALIVGLSTLAARSAALGGEMPETEKEAPDRMPLPVPDAASRASA